MIRIAALVNIVLMVDVSGEKKNRAVLMTQTVVLVDIALMVIAI